MHRHESKCIQEIVGDVMAKLGRVIAVEGKNQVGIDSRVHKVNAMLNLRSDEVHFIGIWGMRGIENVVGMWLDFSTPKDVVIKNEAFENMKKLRLLKINNACVSRCPNCIPNEIQWLNQFGYPSKSLPESFQPEKLVGLMLQYRHVIQLWKGIKLDILKYINLSYSQKLIRTPDFTGIPNLERLILEDCSSLTEIHPSAGYLKRLQLFNLRNCTSLRSLPKQIILRESRSNDSLRMFKSWGISKNLECYGSFKSSTIIFLKHLKTLSFRECQKSEDSTGLVLPSVSGLNGLAKLDLSDCNLLDGGFLCDLGSLIELNLGCRKYQEPQEPSNPELVGCKRLEILPELPLSIEEVYADNCTSLQSTTDLLTKSGKVHWASFNNCFQMLQDKQTFSLICATWNHLLKFIELLSTKSDTFKCISHLMINKYVITYF
ncbi:unnamed protein product [Coffea canephora]|uniref:DH200=94 genomic scaffold, scaffold_705 n=1 Tax=Coffea canephora TaxID=49390 RepID=A0A068VJF5_COFCA|nr:unnamed protein product [Coffea canephora]